MKQKFKLPESWFWHGWYWFSMNGTHQFKKAGSISPEIRYSYLVFRIEGKTRWWSIYPFDPDVAFWLWETTPWYFRLPFFFSLRMTRAGPGPIAPGFLLGRGNSWSLLPLPFFERGNGLENSPNFLFAFFLFWNGCRYHDYEWKASWIVSDLC